MNSVSIRFLGGAKRIGCSSVLINNSGKGILIDYGSNPSNEFTKPIDVNPLNLQSVVLSHAHIDHSGALPMLYKGALYPLLIATPPTIDLTALLIRDMMKILKGDVPFSELDLDRMLQTALPLKYNKPVNIGDGALVELLDAGHIPGSSSVLVSINGKKIWYTGDINLIESRLLKPADVYREADIVIMETTYANRDHPDRIGEEQRLVKRAEEIVEDKGVVLIPAFSVGRSQEIISILTKYDFNGSIALDGMARPATEIILRHPEFIKDFDLLERAVSRVKWIRSRGERKKLLKKPGVIVAPAGMLSGGWAEWYLKHVYDDEKNGIFLVSFQVPGTLGYRIANERKFFLAGKEKHISAQVEVFELSGHSGRKELFEIVKSLENPEKIFLMHGEEGTIDQFADELKEMGLDVVVAEEDVVYKID
ncbi:MAG: MBL fold metallo-hydrolase [Candidatus Njordarchaeia archaeon]